MQIASIRVLLVEDEPADAEFVKRSLVKTPKNIRFEVCCTDGVSQAIEALNTSRFDVLLLDLGLPEYCGLEALQEIRRRNHEIPIVVLTGLRDEKVTLESLEQGAQDYLVKGDLTADSLSRSIRYSIQRQQLLATTLERQFALEARAKLAAIVEFSDDAIISEKLDGCIVSWNQGAEHIYGYTADEALGRTVEFLLPPDQRSHFQQIGMAVRAGERFRPFDTVFNRKDGTPVDISLSVSPIRDDEGRVIGISTIARDISERRRIEVKNQQLAAECNRLLRQLQLQIERMPLAYIFFDADFRIIDWNPAAESIFGYRKDEVVGRGPPFDQFVPPSVWPESQELLARIRAGDMSANSVNDNITKDGRTITCEWFNTPLTGADGEFSGLVCLALDITERNRTEIALRNSQERYELAIRGSSDGLGDWDLETGEAFWSPRLKEIFGYSLEDISFESNFSAIASRVHPDDRDRVLQDLVESTRLRQPSESEFRVRTKSGEYRWVQGRGQAVFDTEGKPCRFAGAVTDISARKQMEAELAQRDEQIRQTSKLEAVGSLAGGVAHEFNNLLQAIRGYGQYAMEGLLPTEQRHKDLEQVVKAADRAAVLTRQLLGFSRRQVLERVTFDPREVVVDLVKMLRPLIGEHIELEINIATDAGSLHADRGLLQQMLLNLCINARDAMPNGGTLSLKTQRVELTKKYCELHPTINPGSYILFSVSDTGCGMTPEVKARIFEPFFTTKGVGSGTGLGLAMVYGSVQQHKGMINVYSELGLGATFKIYLPMIAGGESTVVEALREPTVGGRETILIAEDEPMVRDLALRILTGAGYSVLVARDGVEALNQLKDNSEAISLVILDAVMPKLTGRQVYDNIKIANPNLPVIFCSGYDPAMGQVKTLMDQGLRLVQKPYDPDDFLRTVREVLDARLKWETSLCLVQ